MNPAYLRAVYTPPKATKPRATGLLPVNARMYPGVTNGPAPMVLLSMSEVICMKPKFLLGTMVVSEKSVSILVASVSVGLPFTVT